MPKRILFVDDEREALELYKSFAEIFGDYEITTASSLEEAEKYKGQEFDIAVIDSLEGRWKDVGNLINAKRKIICSGDSKTLELARTEGHETHDKRDLKNLFDKLES